MEKQKNYTLDFETFGEGEDRYIMKLNVCRNHRHYLRIIRRVDGRKSPYDGTGVNIFEDDLPFFVEALSMIMTRFTHGEGRPA